MSAPLHVVVVGSGPSGFYAAAALLAAVEPGVRVDLLERLPTPWGLVRSGVAPDHPKIKSVSGTFEQIAAHERFRWYGNVDLGADVTRDELLEQYDAVVYALGAQTDRHLGVPGEELAGSVAASDVVGWYNGHPLYPDLALLLDGARAVVVGNGNVALDVARMLCTDVADLGRTDIADHALDVLAASAVREVLVVGRRGPAQATFTTLELRELGDLTDVDVVVEPDGVLDVADEGLPPVVRRNLKALRDLAARPPTPGARRLVFRFLRSPVELRGAGKVHEVVLACNDLVGDDTGLLRARDTGAREVVDAALVVRAVGYLGVPVEGLPFDEVPGHIPHEQGRVVGHEREYVVGWIKRGPTGVIGTNKKDARESVERLLTDLAGAGARDTGADRPERLERWLRGKRPDLVSDTGWQAIDEAERHAGQTQGRPRVKLVRIQDLLAAVRDHEDR
ncbi:MAG TPA: FAD-dependent oxidoreductase [Nocardioidaceae bacterium]|nr:FAD-dependent oxidoreductase [Nocardioidaceae bacterium]